MLVLVLTLRPLTDQWQCGHERSDAHSAAQPARRREPGASLSHTWVCSAVIMVVMAGVTIIGSSFVDNYFWLRKQPYKS